MVRRALSLVNPGMRELLEMRYLFERPFIVDSSKIAAKLGVHATPIDQALEGTLTSVRSDGHGI
ncbi:MAG: hypothetical protein GEV10_03155 [Streptosporangiales bacterium]|nr:hypothetical protein [Streptosporangiales bacterium]